MQWFIYIQPQFLYQVYSVKAEKALYLYNDENVVARIFSTLSFTEYLILRQMVSNWTSYTFHYNVRNEN